MTDSSQTIFLSYATPDRHRVQPFYERLSKAGFNAWVDYDKIKVGQNWDFELRRALNHASFVIVFISHNSIDRRGYLQRELKMALDRRAEKLIDDIYLLPVLLDDDVSVPSELADLQYVRASQPDCQTKVNEAIESQIAKFNIGRRTVQREHGLTWNIIELKESWDGLPGYDVRLQFVDVKSTQHGNTGEIGDIIKAHFLESLLSHRRSRFEQSPSIFNHAQTKFVRTNTTDAVCKTPSLVGNVLSITYEVAWYGAGAAHPNYGFRVFNFVLDPVTSMPPLEGLFKDANAALQAIQKDIRSKLCALQDESGGALLDREWVDQGTENWAAFSNHEFVRDGIRVLFSPYAVGPFSLGTHAIVVDFNAVLDFMQAEYVDALGIRYLRYQNGR